MYINCKFGIPNILNIQLLRTKSGNEIGEKIKGSMWKCWIWTWIEWETGCCKITFTDDSKWTKTNQYRGLGAARHFEMSEISSNMTNICSDRCSVRTDMTCRVSSDPSKPSIHLRVMSTTPLLWPSMVIILYSFNRSATVLILSCNKIKTEREDIKSRC